MHGEFIQSVLSGAGVWFKIRQEVYLIMSHANDERPEIDPCFQSPRKQGFTLILIKIRFISATRWTFWNRQCYSNLSKDGREARRGSW